MDAVVRFTAQNHKQILAAVSLGCISHFCGGLLFGLFDNEISDLGDDKITQYHLGAVATAAVLTVAATYFSPSPLKNRICLYSAAALFPSLAWNIKSWRSFNLIQIESSWSSIAYLFALPVLGVLGLVAANRRLLEKTLPLAHKIAANRSDIAKTAALIASAIAIGQGLGGLFWRHFYQEDTGKVKARTGTIAKSSLLVLTTVLLNSAHVSPQAAKVVALATAAILGFASYKRQNSTIPLMGRVVEPSRHLEMVALVAAGVAGLFLTSEF